MRIIVPPLLDDPSEQNFSNVRGGEAIFNVPAIRSQVERPSCKCQWFVGNLKIFYFVVYEATRPRLRGGVFLMLSNAEAVPTACN